MNISCCKSYVGKQIIGLLPNESECFFYYSPNVDVQGWFIDGIDSTDVGSVNGILNPYGYLYNFFALIDGTYRFILSYIGTTPPTYLPVILDSGSNPVTWTLTNCCNKVCLEGTFNAADAVYLQTGYGWNWYNGAAIFGHPSVEEAIKSLYGTQTIYTATDNGDGTFYIKIDNAFACNLPLSWSEDNVTYTDMVPCGTPPAATCLFSSSALTDSTGAYCFTDLSWDFNGQGIDFTAASAVYGGYAVNDGDPTILPYGGDTCSKVTFLYIGQNQPADVNVIDPVYGSYPLPIANQYCSFGCLTTNSIYCKDLIYYGIALNGFITVPFSSYGSSTIDLTDLVGSETIINAILSKYVPGSTVNITADGADYFTFTFNDIYFNPSNTNFDLIDSSGTSAVTQSMIDC